MDILRMRGISKAFDANQVLHNVDFTVAKGEIHALLGENGAGKSTLLNILAGVLPGDTGTITLDGVAYPHPSITQMEKAGVAFVHQELNVINDLTVSENIFFNHELTRGLGILRAQEMISQTRELLESLGVELGPTVKVAELKTSEKQLLEICKALHADAKLLILDEPTTALGNDEIAHLFSILRKLKEDGRALIFVSHKMPEIFEIADSYTVLRNGELISVGAIADVTPERIVRDMVGEQYADKDVYTVRELGEPILQLRGFSGVGFESVNLTVRRGEVVALTGLAGSGASEVMQTMFGALPIIAGQVFVHGDSVHGDIPRFMRRHVGMLPTNRKENSVVPDFSVLDNIMLAEHSLTGSHPVIHRKPELVRFGELKQTLSIRAQSPDDAITSLSGGNQQKVFLARWLNIDADILLLDNPTQGVDVGAKGDIYAQILDLAKAGKTIIINTLEIPEIRKVSDRCVVFYAGHVVAILDHDAINEHDVMLYSTNAAQVGEEEE
ncbi:MAG: sugar ABC transporter ATP-binding protein [Propionibacteriaceae bacterium]|jgi:ribose transport system ATP-binding protein|nr:sugar ABC transporter ATP-binding protein [Propionibacteriaceae bacterium]